MIEFTSSQLMGLLSGFLWPLVRILGLIASAPILSHPSIPVRVRLSLGIAITLLVAPGLPPLAQQDLLSLHALLILVQQFLIGVSFGFVLRIIFTGVELAGEMIGMTMGLGFATFFDPSSAGRSTVISQFLTLLTILFFLAGDFHLQLIDTLAQSFTLLPIDQTPSGRSAFEQLSYWGGRIFIIGVQLSLPVITALFIVNLALGVLNRAAPHLNLFNIGFPLTLLTGYLMMALTLPYWVTPLHKFLQSGLQKISGLALGFI